MQRILVTVLVLAVALSILSNWTLSKLENDLSSMKLRVQILEQRLDEIEDKLNLAK